VNHTAGALIIAALLLHLVIQLRRMSRKTDAANEGDRG
jgi:hypothetical protein